MDYIRKLSYTDTDETQYAEVDLESHDIVDAEYTRVKGYEGNADVEALPLPLSGTELIAQESVIPAALLDPGVDPFTAVSALRALKIPLNIQKTVDRILYKGLIRSYEGRRYALTKHAVSLTAAKDIQVNILSSSYTNNVVEGASIIGLPGTGKSTAISISLRRYPKAILHDTVDGSYVQVPVIKTTAFTNGNLSALFQMFAARLDDILDTGTTHQDLLPRVNIGAMCSKIIGWIQTYHIGCWIIEEISFFEFSNSSRSFENVVSIMQETGVFLFVTGNTDFYRKISGNLRLERRLLSNFVNMDDTSKDRTFMKTFLKKIWKYTLPDLRPLFTDEMADAVLDITMGSVDMMTILISAVQSRYLEEREKYARKGKKRSPAEIVNADMVKKIGTKQLERMRALYEDGQLEAITEYKNIRTRFDNGLKKTSEDSALKEKMELEAAINEDISTGYDHAAKLFMVKERIKDVFDDAFTDKQIEYAFSLCEKNVEGFKGISDRKKIQAVRAKLESMEKRKKEKKAAAVKAKEDEMLKDLMEAM